MYRPKDLRGVREIKNTVFHRHGCLFAPVARGETFSRTTSTQPRQRPVTSIIFAPPRTHNVSFSLFPCGPDLMQLCQRTESHIHRTTLPYIWAFAFRNAARPTQKATQKGQDEPMLTTRDLVGHSHVTKLDRLKAGLAPRSDAIESDDVSASAPSR